MGWIQPQVVSPVREIPHNNKQSRFLRRWHTVGDWSVLPLREWRNSQCACTSHLYSLGGRLGGAAQKHGTSQRSFRRRDYLRPPNCSSHPLLIHEKHETKADVIVLCILVCTWTFNKSPFVLSFSFRRFLSQFAISG